MRKAVLVLTFVGVGCSSTSSTSSDSGVDDAATDGGASDAASDAGPVDGSTSDGGECKLMGGNYDKTCTTAADCLMVARGCYCGAQPIIGVAKGAAAAAQKCETANSTSCALGCPNAPGHVAEDNQNDEGTGRNIEVRCDNNQCHTVLP